jgi:hypothetical protein
MTALELYATPCQLPVTLVTERCDEITRFHPNSGRRKTAKFAKKWGNVALLGLKKAVEARSNAFADVGDPERRDDSGKNVHGVMGTQD